MQPENAIEVRNVVKTFKVYLDKGYTLKELTLFSKRRKYEKRKVLNGISFDIKKGEAVGLIGQNGCGKSTTLKLLTRIMYPDSGTIEMKGRVSSLIELGAGFHPDMSGRQNIYTNASIFGLTRKEIDARVNDIIVFSELEEFIDTPVRTYSSGMYMRLAFAVAINVDADILLIDEILAVGDASFQAKCFNKLREIKARGTTIVIVSHSLGQLEVICDRNIWINDGLIKEDGKPIEVNSSYLDFMGKKRQSQIEKKQKQEQEEQKCIHSKMDTQYIRPGNGKIRITEILQQNKQAKAMEVFKTGDEIYYTAYYTVNETLKNAVFGIGIFRNDGMRCYGTNTKLEQILDINIEENGKFSITIKNIMLLPGEYWIQFDIEEEDGTPVDSWPQAKKFQIYSNIADIGIFRQDHRWIF